MGEHVIGIGKSVERAVKCYNGFGSIESRLMPQARRFAELEVDGTGTVIEMATSVEIMPRQLQGGRDILVALPSAAEPVAVPAAG